jgi:butyryl-CoA dehydrogenase
MDAEGLTRYPLYAEHSREVFELVLDTALKLSRDLFKPVLHEMDKDQPRYVDGRVFVHPVVKQIMKACGEGGWISASASYEMGGQQLPLLIMGACRFIFSAANYSASVYPFLTTGAAHLIESFGSDDLKDLYIPRMFAGRWQGTMALTEPQAGSSLSDITTQAVPTDQGYYKIKGQKIFISAAEHDGVENIVNLMLAKIKGGPPGVKGISLFVVPKMRPDESGALVPNDVTCAGIYHKLGYRGAPITQLSMGENDDCRGWLVGEAHKGLSYMFQMMNEARIDVGMGAAAIASAAYYASLEYAQQRPQGRAPGAKDPTQPQVPIIRHPDVKRMLLFQRAVVEGSLAVILQCAKYADLVRVTSGEERERNFLLLELLTPIAKTYPSEMGILSVSAGLQCLGGYGYCDEFPLEQFYRDMRIHPIHEGTTGIQGLDLLGRKVIMHQGRALGLFAEEVRRTIASGMADPEMAPRAADLAEGLERLQEITRHLLGVAAKGNPELFLADATLYLEFFGIICVAWQWLAQALVARSALQGTPSEAEANFYHGKLHAFRFYYSYELPKMEGLAKRLMESDGLTVAMPEAYFMD